MGTDKRARQKANRAARIEAAYEQQRKEEGRKRGVNVAVVVAVLAVLVGGYLFFTRDDGDEQVASGDSSSTSSSVAPAATTSGPCYDLANDPEGAPDLGLPTTEKLTELETEDLVVGTGDPVAAGSTVTVDYIGFANSTGEQFDDSFSRGTPATFSLDQVIAGWTEGIPGMQPGGSRLLRIPAADAYGETGSPPAIGPNEDLTFCVTMVGSEAASTSSTTATAGPASVPPPGAGASITGETPCPPAEGAERTTSFEQAPPPCLEEGKAYTATFETNKGRIVVDLDTERTPATANNFAVLARYGYYDGTAVFRTEPSIDIIQGGSPTTNTAADPGPGYTIEDEGGEFDFSEAAGPNGKGPFTYTEGQLVMARAGGPNAAGAQYFFTAGPNAANLDAAGTYVVFGTVTEGLDVVQQILALHTACSGSDPTCNGGGPSEPVIVDRVTIAEA